MRQEQQNPTGHQGGVAFDNESYRRIVDNLYEGLYFVDRDRRITYWNKAAEQISGYSADEVVGRHCHDNILTHIDEKGNQLCFGLCPLAATIGDGQPREAEVYLHHKEGHRVPVSVRVTPLYDDNGEIIGGIELFSDISNRSANQLRLRELEELAYVDTLTKLANRAYSEIELSSRLEEHRRYGVPFGVLFIDIDHFKAFNDTWGHELGDRVLRFVADTFTANSRPFDTFGRWGGEEFIAILRNIEAGDLEKLAERYRRAVEAAYIVHDDEQLHVTISVGATIVGAEDTPESLVTRADRMLYVSKDGGRNRVTLAPADR